MHSGDNPRMTSSRTFQSRTFAPFARVTSAKAFVALSLMAVAFMGQAHADGLQSLENFLKTAKTGQSNFSQTVTSPPRDGQAPRKKTTTGTFDFQRPEKFRFKYNKPFEQTIVADGQTLWLYDADLNQVTSRKQAQALSSTPAALIASAADVNALKAVYTLENAPDRDGLQWVKATPKAKDGQVQTVQVGFRGADLASLEILDGFGQTSVISFTDLKVNAPLPAGTFEFKAPAGADVIRQ